MGLYARHRTLVCTLVESKLPHREREAGGLHKTDFYSREFFSSGVRAGRIGLKTGGPIFATFKKFGCVKKERDITLSSRQVMCRGTSLGVT